MTNRDVFRIALDWNNTDDLQRLSDFDPCRFQAYRRYIDAEWIYAEDLELGGDRLKKRIGLPYIIIHLARVDLLEWQLLIEEFGYSSKVTVHVENTDEGRWINANGNFHLPLKPEKNGGYYDDVEIEVRDLKEI